jgi:hypothetical protein
MLLVVRGDKRAVSPMYQSASHDDAPNRYCLLDISSDGRVVSRETFPASSSRKLTKRCQAEALRGKEIALDQRDDANLVAGLKLRGARDASEMMLAMRLRKAEWEKSRLMAMDALTRERIKSEEPAFRSSMASEGYMSRTRVARKDGFTQRSYGLKHHSGLVSDVCDIQPHSEEWRSAKILALGSLDQLKSSLRVGSRIATAESAFVEDMARHGMTVKQKPVSRIGYEPLEHVGADDTVDPHDVLSISADFTFRGARAVIRHAYLPGTTAARSASFDRQYRSSISNEDGGIASTTSRVRSEAQKGLVPYLPSNGAFEHADKFFVYSTVPSSQFETATHDKFFPLVTFSPKGVVPVAVREAEVARKVRLLSADMVRKGIRKSMAPKTKIFSDDPIQALMKPYDKDTLKRKLNEVGIDLKPEEKVTNPPELYRAIAVLMPYVLDIVNGTDVGMSTNLEFFAKDAYAMTNARNAWLYMLRLKHENKGAMEMDRVKPLPKGTLGQFWYHRNDERPLENWSDCNTCLEMIKKVTGDDGNDYHSAMDQLNEKTGRPEKTGNWFTAAFWDESQFLDLPLVTEEDRTTWRKELATLRHLGSIMATYGNLLESYNAPHGWWAYMGAEKATVDCGFKPKDEEWHGINVYPTNDVATTYVGDSHNRSKPDKVMKRFFYLMWFACYYSQAK